MSGSERQNDCHVSMVLRCPKIAIGGFPFPRGTTDKQMPVSGVPRSSLTRSSHAFIRPTSIHAISGESLVSAVSCGSPDDASQPATLEAARRTSVVGRETAKRDRLAKFHPPGSVAGPSLGTIDDGSGHNAGRNGVMQ